MAAGDSISDSFADSITLIPPPSTTSSLVSINHIRRAGEPDSDHCSLIFPPTHHENLHLKPPPIVVSPSSSSCSEIVDETTPFSPPPARKLIRFGPGFGFEMLFSKAKMVLLGLRISPAKKSAFAAVAAAAMGIIFLWWRRRRGRRIEWNQDRVDRIIREKDERIEQLLNQIARMNDLLLGLKKL